MSRSEYYKYIAESLTLLAFRLEISGKLNLLDDNIQSEAFYLHFFNMLFDWNLENLNLIEHNAAGIDLIDNTNKIVIQVSTTATKQKIESALSKDLSLYKGYSFKFISISKDAKNLRKRGFNNPHNLYFLPAVDIFDIQCLLKIILNMDIDRQKAIYEFLIKEIKNEPSFEKVESNLTTIITILSEEDLNQRTSGFEKIPFDIESKISYNQLNKARTLINDYKIHCSRINKIYSEFDKIGKNKSLSVLNSIRKEYITLYQAGSPDQLFFSIIDKVVKKIHSSANYKKTIKLEELELYVGILVVEAFIRCEIFENPMEKTNACS